MLVVSPVDFLGAMLLVVLLAVLHWMGDVLLTGKKRLKYSTQIVVMRLRKKTEKKKPNRW